MGQRKYYICDLLLLVNYKKNNVILYLVIN